jgi:hypothetical protein
MKASSILCVVVIFAASLATLLPARAGDFLHLRRGAVSGEQWNTNYYDPAWGMPLAVVVPPTVRWQSNYAWGVGGSRVDHVGAQYQAEFPGPASVYDCRHYLPAPPQPSDTTQFGVNYVRGPRP